MLLLLRDEKEKRFFDTILRFILAVHQGHLLEGWPAAGSKDDDKRRLMDQAMLLDSKYPGGLKAYISKVGGFVGSFVWVGGGSGFFFVAAAS